jgi:hypothetical protein
MVGRGSVNSRWKVYFDPSPDGSQDFDDRTSFIRGGVVATYSAEEFFQVNTRAEVFDTRVDYVILDSKPFEFMGRRIDLAEIAPRLTEFSHAHLPEPDPDPEIIPDEEPFKRGGPGCSPLTSLSAALSSRWASRWPSPRRGGARPRVPGW